MHNTKENKHFKVKHHLPGRTRIHLNKKHGREHARSVRERLLMLPGVNRVDYNERTGSLLVHHEHHPEMLQSLLGTTSEMAGSVVGLVAEAEQVEVAGLLLLAGMLLSGISNLIKEGIVPSRKPGLIHHTKQRTRLRLHDHHHSHEHMGALKSKLEGVRGVHHVAYNHRTGSVTIHHDGSHETIGAVGGVVKDFSMDLFQCIVKHEDPALAGMHLFAEALSNGHVKESDIARSGALLLVAFLMSDGLAVRV